MTGESESETLHGNTQLMRNSQLPPALPAIGLIPQSVVLFEI